MEQLTTFPILKDDSPMPYGTHKGTVMKAVPAKYLLWLEENNKCSKSVQAYITDNRKRLETEAGVKAAKIKHPPGTVFATTAYKRR